MLRLLLTGAMLALASSLPSQDRPFNVRVLNGAFFVPTTWLGQPAFLIACVGERHSLVEFTNPALGFVDVTLEVQLWGALDSRPCVDPSHPIGIGYAVGEHVEPLTMFAGGIEAWLPRGDSAPRFLSWQGCRGLPYCSWTAGACDSNWQNCATQCANPRGAQLLFFIVTASLS